MFRRLSVRLYHKGNNVSPVTNQPLPEAAQGVLSKIAKTRGFKSRYWVTGAQGARVFGQQVRHGEEPTRVTFDVSSVTEMSNLSTADQQKILDEHPPFFAGGIGLFGGARSRWLPVASGKLRHMLNPHNKERALWIDEKIVNEWKLKLNPGSKFVNIGNVSCFEVYNAEQMEDPGRVYPLEGLALSAMNGKRFSQPAHDLLVALGVAKGYTSPFWIAANMANPGYMYGTTMKDGWQKHVVEVPTASGLCVNFDMLPDPIQSLLAKHSPPPKKPDFFQIFGAGGWETVRRAAIIDALVDCAASRRGSTWTNPKCWVNLDELNALMSPTEVDAVLQKHKVDTKLAIDLEKLCMNSLINASLCKDPHYILPKTRLIAIRRGRLLGGQAEQELRLYQRSKNFPSPIWLNRLEAKKLGVGILPDEKGFVLGRDIKELGELYNIEDFENPSAIFERYPPPSLENLSGHQIFTAATWRIDKTVEVCRILNGEGRTKKLWVGASEVVFGGFALKNDAKPVAVSKSKGVVSEAMKQSDNRKISVAQADRGELFNVAQTTDPVRVIALMNYFVRPKGSL
jgi:hypothetical protein